MTDVKKPLIELEGTDLPKASDRPTKHQTKEELRAQAEVIAARKEEAASPDHKVKKNGSWREQFSIWQNATHDEKCDIVFGLVMHDGAIKIRDITRFFNIKADELTPFTHIFEAAKAALKLKIQRNMISLGLQREDQPMMKFNLTKQYAEQTDNPLHADVTDLNDPTRNNVVIKVIGKDGQPIEVSQAQKIETYTSSASTKLQ